MSTFLFFSCLVNSLSSFPIVNVTNISSLYNKIYHLETILFFGSYSILNEMFCYWKSKENKKKKGNHIDISILLVRDENKRYKRINISTLFLQYTNICPIVYIRIVLYFDFIDRLWIRKRKGIYTHAKKKKRFIYIRGVG